MEWMEIILSVAVADTDAAASIAHMAVPYGIYIEDYSDLETGAREIAHSTLIDEALLARDRTRARIHLYIAPHENAAEALLFLTERLTAAGIEHTAVSAAVREEDWANNWKQHFKPMPVGNRLLICPGWETPPPPEGRAVLTIDPGMAFGTGSHDTTRMMLERLESVVTPGCQMLDIGCGSGILAISALLMGAERATGIDIDPVAVRVAAENGRCNGFAPPVLQVLHGDLARDVKGTFDIVAANIVADAILALSPAVKALLAPEGRYLMAGIIDTRAEEVLDGLAAIGMTITHRADRAGWVMLEAKAPRCVSGGR